MGIFSSSPATKYLFVEEDVTYFKRLGLGSFGEVFEVKWRGEMYAAKRLHEELVKYDNGGPGGIVADFRRECDHLRQLDHQNIVKLVEAIFPEGKPPVLITELLDCDLESFIKNSTTEPKVSFIDTVNIMQDVAEGLKYLHTRTDPIVHRDLASKNILLTNRKQAKIADLGLAKTFPGVYFTSPKPTTAPYAAPETFPRPSGPTTYERPEYGVEIDVFSFGVVLLEVLNGRLPTPNPLYSPYTSGKYKDRPRQYKYFICPYFRFQLQLQSGIGIWRDDYQASSPSGSVISVVHLSRPPSLPNESLDPIRSRWDRKFLRRLQLSNFRELL